ncbi:MAG: sigma factor-like helix-turn-helix DNA-binding protein [Pirellulaceae bacterium]
MCRDLLRRYRIGSEAASVHALKTAIAKDAERRMAEDQLNLKQVLEILEKWDRSGTEQQRKFAQVIRLYYIVELNDDEVDRDAGLTLKEIAERTGTPLATVARWREKALEALRKDVEDVH